MFKINHWGGVMGTYMIGLGLCVEAILFFTLGFFPPAQEPAWEKVYPELDPDFEGNLPARKLAVVNGGAAALDKMLADADVNPESINRLGEGLKKFTEKVDRINTISDVSLATDEFSNKLKFAASKFDLLGITFEKASAGMAAVVDNHSGMDAYYQQVSKLTFNLAQLNTLYEDELRGADANLRRVNNFYSGLSDVLSNLNESTNDSRVFKDEVGKLAKNISALNAFYANMLAAMNQPRMG